MEKKKFLTLDEENCQGIKLRIAHKIKRLNSHYHDDIIKAF